MDALGKKLNERVQKHLDGTRERWRDVVGYEGLYRVSDWGRVKSVTRRGIGSRGRQTFRPGRIRKVCIRKKDGRGFISVSRNGVPTVLLPYRLVLEAFVGPCPPGMEGRHYPDQNPSNNRLENISWATASCNQMDRVENGTSNRGERQGQHKLTAKGVLVARRLYASGLWSYGKLVKLFGVSYGPLYRAINGITWSHV
jgi:hypothetical protein